MTCQMDAPIRVSIVLPFLNAERFIKETIDSVLAQTYAAWELLLVDDGSDDSSTAIAREYARHHPARIRYIEHAHHNNLGISASRNVGVRHARGEFIAELDADDVWLPEKLEHHIPILDAHPDVGMLYGNSLYWYSWSGCAEDASRDYLPAIGADTNKVVEPVDLLLRQLEGTVASPCPCAVILRKSVIERVGGSNDAFRGTHEDLVLYAKMMLAAPVFVVDGWSERYRCYSAPSDSVSATEQQSGRLETERRKYLMWLAAYLRAQGLGASEHYRLVLATLRRNRFPHFYRLSHHGRRWPAFLGSIDRIVRASKNALQRSPTPRVGQVRMGDLRRVMPINRHWGWERGGPVDRYYIENFLAKHAEDVRGRVLEVGDDSYTRQFGAAEVTTSDVLDISDNNPHATIVADLADAGHVADDAFDCVILTQTLQYVYDVRAAFRALRRILAPGGTLLLTVPGISQTTDGDEDLRSSRYWSFTASSVTRVATEVFSPEHIQVESHGNVLTAVAFLHGLAPQELAPAELAYADRDFPLVITLRARKPLF